MSKSKTITGTIVSIIFAFVVASLIWGDAPRTNSSISKNQYDTAQNRAACEYSTNEYIKLSQPYGDWIDNGSILPITPAALKSLSDISKAEIHGASLTTGRLATVLREIAAYYQREAKNDANVDYVLDSNQMSFDSNLLRDEASICMSIRRQ